MAQPEEIKRANRMMSNSVAEFSVLRIPSKAGVVPALPQDSEAALRAHRLALKSVGATSLGACWFRCVFGCTVSWLGTRLLQRGPEGADCNVG